MGAGPLQITRSASSASGGVTSVTASSPLASSGGATPDISISGQVDVPHGGTGLASGTSGGVPYFNASTTMASSSALAASQFVLGGGAGAAPNTTNSVALTTKGDLLTFSTVLARLGVGSDGQVLTADSASTPGIKWAAATATNTYNDPLALQNVGLAVSVGASAITIALKQQDGSTDPNTGTAAVNIAFASATATSGGTTMRSVTSALSLTISNGSSLGFASTTATQRVWVGAIDNAGTVVLGAWTSLSGTNLRRFNDGDVVSTTAEGGAGGADSAQTIYTTAAQTSKVLRVLGYFEIQAAASYAWTNSPSVVRVMQPGLPKTGDVIQRLRTSTAAVITGTNTTPFDDTIPQLSETNLANSQAITPTSSLNVLKIEANGTAATSSGADLMAQGIWQDSTANAIAVQWNTTLGANNAAEVFTSYQMLAGTTSSTTFKQGFAGSAAGTTTINGTSAARKYGGVLSCYISVEEIFQ